MPQHDMGRIAATLSHFTVLAKISTIYIMQEDRGRRRCWYGGQVSAAPGVLEAERVRIDKREGMTDGHPLPGASAPVKIIEMRLNDIFPDDSRGPDCTHRSCG